MKHSVLVLCVVLVLFSVSETRKTTGGGRRGSSGTSWGNSGSKPKPSTTFSHSQSDITKLSYGNHETSGLRRQSSPPKPTNTHHDTHKPSAPAPPSNTHTEQRNVGWNTQSQPNANPNQNPNSNIGWNVNQGQGQHPNPGNNPQGQNIGWNVPKSGQNPTQTHVNPVNNAPPGYHANAPPGYNAQPGYHAPPGYNAQPGYHPPGQPAPGYPGYQQVHGQPPPPYPGYSQPGYHGQNQYPSPGYQQPYGGYGGHGNYGGYGGGGYGGGGFPGGGFGFPGSSPGFGGFGGFGNQQRSSGLGTGTSILTGALLGYTLSNLLRDNSNTHYYYPNSRTVNSNNPQGNQPGSGNVVHTVNGEQGSYTSYVGNMTCMSIYNAKEVGKWANNTLQDFYKSYPNQPFPVQNSTNPGLNFTVVPGDIIHNETLAVTCCGTDKGQVDLNDLVNGKVQGVNCVYETYVMPFRKLKFILVNSTNTNNTTDNSTSTSTTSTTTTTVQTTTPEHITTIPTSTTNGTTQSTAQNLTTVHSETTLPSTTVHK